MVITRTTFNRSKVIKEQERSDSLANVRGQGAANHEAGRDFLQLRRQQAFDGHSSQLANEVVTSVLVSVISL